MTEEGKGTDEDSVAEAVDALTRFTRTANKYLTIIRVTPYVIMSIGAAIIIKEFYIVKRFHSITKIPNKFIKNQWWLRGTFCGVDPHGDLLIKHQPKIRFWKDFNPDSRLRVHLLGIVQTRSSIVFLETSNLIGKNLHFRPIAISPDNTKLYAVVQFKRMRLNESDMGRDLVNRGLAFVAPVGEWPKAPGSYDWYVRKIVSAEAAAEMVGKGLWKTDQSQGRVKRWINSLRQLVRRWMKRS